jgi:hypothetical protein
MVYLFDIICKQLILLLLVQGSPHLQKIGRLGLDFSLREHEGEGRHDRETSTSFIET